MTANNFRVAVNSAISVIYEVCLAICGNLGPKYIRLSKTEEARSLNLKQNLE